MTNQWLHQAFATLNINQQPPYPSPDLPFLRSYHSSDESDPVSHGGGDFHPTGHGHFGGHGRLQGPSVSSNDRLLGDTPYIPPREPQQRQDAHPQFGGHAVGDRSHYRFGHGEHMQQPPQWPAHEHMLPAPAPYHAEPSYFYQPEQSSNPSFPNAMPPSAFQSSPRFPDAGDYLRQQLNLPPGAPVNLWSVPEPPNGEKPTIPLPMLIKLAIYGNNNKKLTLKGIYKELIDRFHWFREHQNEAAWKNSIRHNLSLNKVFRTMQRPVTEPGKGSYWELDVSGGEGYKRARKRLGPKKNTGPGTSADDDEEVSEGSYSETKPNDRDFRGKGRRRHRSHESSSPPTTGSSRSGSVPTVPTIDPPASQRRATTSGTYGRQPAYGQQGFPPLAIDPALIGPGGPTNYPPPSSYTPPGHTLAHLHSATPIDAAGTRDEGIASRLRARTQMSRSASAGMYAESSSSSHADDGSAGKSRRRSGRT